MVGGEARCQTAMKFETGKANFRDFPVSKQVRVLASRFPPLFLYCSLSDLSRIFLLTAVVAVDELIAIAFGLADLVALFAVVETGIVLIVVPRWWWRRFWRTRDGNVASRAYAAPSD